LVFGIVLVSYFGHLSVSNCAQTVLKRDPSGRSLKRGTAAAMVVAIVIYSIWSVSVVSAVGSENLLGQTGTALVPLAKQIGPEIYILGVVFAILGLGMSSVHFGLGIFNLSRELIGQTQSCSKPSWFRSQTSTLAAVLPIILVFSYVQWTYYNGTASFTAPLELIGALLTPVLAGIFPVLLLVASRKKTGEPTDATVGSVASHPLILTTIVLLSFAGLLAHGFVLWENPLSQACALFVTTTMSVLIFDQGRRGLFSSSSAVVVAVGRWRSLPVSKTQ
jgi:amino acid permease